MTSKCDADPAGDGGVRVVLANITNHGWVLDTGMSFMLATNNELEPAELKVESLLAEPCGPYLDDGRNKCVAKFLDDCEAPWLLFVDSDIRFSRDDVYRLISDAEKAGEKLVAGAYYSPRGGIFYTVAYNWQEAPSEGDLRAHSNGMILMDVPIGEVLSRGHFMPVDAMGTGFMAIHRDVLEHMMGVYEPPQMWFAELVMGGVHLGEDLTFCLRAKALGYQPQLHCGVRLTHFKECGLSWEFARLLDAGAKVVQAQDATGV